MKRKDWKGKDELYHCWFCDKPLTEKEVIWRGNIERPVCKKHKNSLSKIMERF